MKTLYFEGAGWENADVSKATVGNCRIRTAFHNNKGKEIFLEMSVTEVSEHSAKSLQKFKYAGFINSCHYIAEKQKDQYDGIIESGNNTVFEYNKENILNFVNRLDCNFDKIEVLPKSAGYKVFNDDYSYNFADEYIITK